MLDEDSWYYCQEGIRETIEGSHSIAILGLNGRVPAMVAVHVGFSRSPEDIKLGSALRVEDDDRCDVDDCL